MQPSGPGYQQIVDEICRFRWSEINRSELLAVSQAYYYFSVQFCETVEMACRLHPFDHLLAELREGQCNSDDLSPYPGVAQPSERMDHGEYMRRVLAMSSLDRNTRARVEQLGMAYLAEIRRTGAETRVMSLPSYEDGGLEKVFSAVLRARDWNEPSLAAFRHFLVEHIDLDSDPDMGHGALCRHLIPDDRIVPLWRAFRDLLMQAAPGLAGDQVARLNGSGAAPALSS
jgi:hypothetical protein